MLVVLTVISEFGAFEILGYQTFTTEVFTEFKFDPAPPRRSRSRWSGSACSSCSPRQRCRAPLAARRARDAPHAGSAATAARGRRARAADPDRARRRRPGGDDRLLDAATRSRDAAGRGQRRRRCVVDAAVQRARRRRRHAARAAGRVRRLPPSNRHARRDRAQHVSDPRGSRGDDRAQPGVLRHALRDRPIRDLDAAGRRLRAARVPARARVRESSVAQLPPALRRRRPLARTPSPDACSCGSSVPLVAPG